MYIQKSLNTYIDDLASRSGVPGGGSAAALTASLGMALSTMVMNFTSNSKRYKKVAGRVKQLLRKNELLRKKVQLLIDKDVVVFLKVQDAFKLAKQHPQKYGMLQKSLKDAVGVPFEICRLCSEAMRLCAEIAGIGNVNLITDTGDAAYLLEAAFKAAELNVRINLKFLGDGKFVANKKKELKKMATAVAKMRKQIIKKVEGYL